MSCDAHIRCNEKVTYDSVVRDVNNNPELKKLWDDAEIDLEIDGCGPDYESFYDKVRDLFPKYRSDFNLGNTMMLSDSPLFSPKDHDKVYLTLKWLAEYLRQLVKRTGEVWYTENWVAGDYLEREDLKVVTYDVNKEICFMKYEDEEFRFAIDTFYRFVDGDEQK